MSAAEAKQNDTQPGKERTVSVRIAGTVERYKDTRPYRRRVDAGAIEAIQAILPPDAPCAAIRQLAALTGFSHSTVWHIVRGYGRGPDAPWRSTAAPPWQGDHRRAPLPLEEDDQP